MSARVKLLEKINGICNSEHLEAILNYLEESENKAFVLTTEDKISIQKSTQEFQNGDFISQEDLNNKAKLWLEK